MRVILKKSRASYQESEKSEVGTLKVRRKEIEHVFNTFKGEENIAKRLDSPYSIFFSRFFISASTREPSSDIW